MDKILKNIGDICLILLASIGLVISISYGFMYYFVFQYRTSVGINNIGDQVGVDIIEKVESAEDLTEEEIDIYEERWFMNANYYSNDKNNGIELQELQLNYFSSFDLLSKNYRSSGIQYLGDYKVSVNQVSSEDDANNHVFDDLYYYDTTNGVSWNGYNGEYGSVATKFNRNEKFIIKIDNEPYVIQLTGGYNTYLEIFGIKTPIIWSTVLYNYPAVFETIFNAIESNSKSYGDYYITLDLSEYFTVYKYDTETNLIVEDNLVDFFKNYCVLKFHYDENGAVNSTQSIFGIIANDSKYDEVDTDIDTSYSKADVYVYINNSDLSLRYSEVYDGYFISMDIDDIVSYNKVSNIKIFVNINLNNYKDKKILGIDYNGFENLKIDTLTIIGSSDKFTLLDYSLHNTNLKYLKYSSTISLDISELAINSDYSEVVL